MISSNIQNKLQEIENDIKDIDTLLDGLNEAFSTLTMIDSSGNKRTINIKMIEEQFEVLRKIRDGLKKVKEVRAQVKSIDSVYEQTEEYYKKFKEQEEVAWKALSKVAARGIPTALKQFNDGLYKELYKVIRKPLYLLPEKYAALSDDYVYYGVYLFVYEMNLDYFSSGIALRLNRDEPQDGVSGYRIIFMDDDNWVTPDDVFEKGEPISNIKSAYTLFMEKANSIPEVHTLLKKRSLQPETKKKAIGVDNIDTFDKSLIDGIYKETKSKDPNVIVMKTSTSRGLQLSIVSSKTVNINQIDDPNDIKKLKTVIDSIHNPLSPTFLKTVLNKLLHDTNIVSKYSTTSSKVTKSSDETITKDFTSIFILVD